ncbi:MAG TPA: EAL domain-containing protein [Sphingobium sp.]|uniref:putative bifunctional diguanylate cyclase/phosphodiesterase n=1 Tax=Sphingobium sp. TaxID=1912891 RepID=UPI002ED0D5C7
MTENLNRGGKSAGRGGDAGDAPSLAMLMGFAAMPAALSEKMIGAQFRAVDRMVVLRIALGLISIAFVLILYWDNAPLWLLGLWSVTSLVSIVPPLRAFLSRRACNYEGLPRNQLWLHAVGMVLQGMLWAGPMLLLAPHGGVLQVASLWTMTTCLLAAVAMGFHATPLAACLFLTVAGGASVSMMLRGGSEELAITVASFSLLMLLATLRQARQFGRQITTDRQLAEKRETVSLLLGEHDDARNDWLWQIDTARRLVGVTSAFARIAGTDAAAIEGKSLLELLAGPAWESGQFDPALHTLAAKIKGREAFANLILPVEVKGARRWWELSASPRLDEHGAFLGFRGVGADVTTQRETEERFTQLARFDQLTQLPNRLHLTEALEQAVEAMTRWNTRSAFLMIDLDRFKSVNDTLGHHIGDRLLAQVAERLRAVCGSMAFCGRLGGDEFAVLIPEIRDATEIEQLSAGIIEHLSQPYEVEHHTLFVGASIGSATGPRDGGTADELIRSADLAMYRAKEEGGGRHFAYITSLHVEAEERRKMEIALRGAIENDELRLEYQPVVHSQSGDLDGFEALLRWHHADFGEVPPSKFLRIAEEARLITALDSWVLKTACEEAVRWPVVLGLSVNLSPELLWDADLIPALEQLLQRTGLDPARLELEVTETVFTRDGAEAVRKLEQVAALGIGLSLDDFGTGYSSLGCLARTRFRTIKIDRSFVAGAAEGQEEHVAILNALIALANSLGIETTAEGVETEREVELVRRVGCTRLQGYYLGRSMRVEDVRRLFARNSRPNAA